MEPTNRWLTPSRAKQSGEPGRLFPWHDRQHDMRGAGGPIMHRVVGHHRGARLAQRAAGVRIHVEAREVGGRDVEPDAMAAAEEVACRVKWDARFVDLA